MSTRTKPITRTWHVRHDSRGYAVYDPEGRYRCHLDTQADADQFIRERQAARRRNAERTQEAAW